MPFSAGPNIAARPNLVFEYDTGDVKNSYIGEPTTNLLTYSSAFNGGPWYGYCGNTSNLTYNTTDVVAPDGSYTALKVVRNNVTVCDGTTPCWGLIYSAGGTLVSGNTYTTSIWARCASGTVSMNFGLSDYYTTTVTLTTTWQRFSFTHNYNPPGQTDRVFQFFSTNQDITYYVWGAQTEIKDHATQYIASGASQGVRSNTQGLLDVSGYNRTMSLANVSFNSSAQITFDGTDDYIYAILFPSAPSVMSAEFVFYKTTSSNTDLSYQGFAPRFALRSNQINLYHATAGQTGDVNFACTINTNTYYHVVLTFDAVNKYQCYLNTVSLSRSYNGDAANGVPGFTETYIGYQAGSEGYFAGSIPICRYYDYALSAQEVRRNYNQLKGRFNLI